MTSKMMVAGIILIYLVVIAAYYMINKKQEPQPEPDLKGCFYAEYDSLEDWDSTIKPPHSYITFNGKKVLVRVPCDTLE